MPVAVASLHANNHAGSQPFATGSGVRLPLKPTGSISNVRVLGGPHGDVHIDLATFVHRRLRRYCSMPISAQSQVQCI